MQVNDMRKKYKTLFELIKIGEVFYWHGDFWIRTELCKAGDVLCNTVNVADGSFAFFENSVFVEKLNAELTIH